MALRYPTLAATAEKDLLNHNSVDVHLMREQAEVLRHFRTGYYMFIWYSSCTILKNINLVAASTFDKPQGCSAYTCAGSSQGHCCWFTMPCHLCVGQQIQKVWTVAWWNPYRTYHRCSAPAGCFLTLLAGGLRICHPCHPFLPLSHLQRYSPWVWEAAETDPRPCLSRTCRASLGSTPLDQIFSINNW